ncbi:MAG: XdhC family protein [Thermoflexales bacterium]|nr:XdhC family protein [Thermoflexales bacterium]MDW8351702.1 XdhC family protein [Anaerolineae bacterium]
MNILGLASQCIERGEPCALVTVIRTSGSVPRHAGAKMLVAAEGTILGGTVGGGEMESRAIQLARQAIADGQPRTASYSLADLAKGDPGVCGGTVELFIEPLLPAPTLLIVGAGHVGRALTHLAKWCGFRVLVSDDRAELCTPEQCPGADAYLPGPLSARLAEVPLTPQTYVALVTRGYPIDVDALPGLLDSPVAYIGVIGSQRRWLTAAKALRERGMSDAALRRVRAPIGLELGAETPEEIAVSIMAEIIMLRRGGHGQPMSEDMEPGRAPIED